VEKVNNLFVLVWMQGEGKQLTWNELTGRKTEE